MFGLDDWITGLSNGASFAVVVAGGDAARAPARHRSRPHRRGDDARRVRTGACSAQRRTARRVVGARPRGHARCVRRPDPRRRAVPPGARTARRRDGGRSADRLPRRPAADPVASRRVRDAIARGDAAQAIVTPSARAAGHSASVSCTGWAGAQASASSSSPPSRARAGRGLAGRARAVHRRVDDARHHRARRHARVAVRRPVGRERGAGHRPREPRVRRLVCRGRMEPRAVSVLDLTGSAARS